MSNPLFNMLNGNKNNIPINNNFISQFQNFMQMMRGQNPQQLLNQIIKANGITQQQLNEIEQQAKQIAPQLEAFKNMFGF